MTIRVSEPDSKDAPYLPTPTGIRLRTIIPRFLAVFYRGVTRLGRLLGIPLPSGRLNLDFWTVNPLGLHAYEATRPLSLHSRTTWGTLLFWEQLMEAARPEPWAPAILHFEIDLREPVTV